MADEQHIALGDRHRVRDRSRVMLLTAELHAVTGCVQSLAEFREELQRIAPGRGAVIGENKFHATALIQRIGARQ